MKVLPKIGSVVTLESDGPKMTVSAISEDMQKVMVTWTDTLGHINQIWLSLNILKLIER